MSIILPKDLYVFLSEYRYQLRKFINFSESAAKDLGITPQQHQLLLTIIGFPEKDSATPREISERLMITHHACVELIDRSEKQGLVYRKPNPEDGRSVLVELSNLGMEKMEKLSKIHIEEIKRIKFLREYES
ncbi:MarR family winged helix-turn-helix transcriptional regulator [Bacillus sp. EB600]|uniref:MarR family winged helix-turn-helix transcriptional regulator n=1 Tax=Bacillus sp. EB600 TaxID=2806345 RepID=UPI00210AF1ED|nr:helix-turn-helix domain-containing protein [Bacillus sp. EB600]MCQ6281960.1 MarR family transcriptional regulator [Bacillus sp. EB600]